MENIREKSQRSASRKLAINISQSHRNPFTNPQYSDLITAAHQKFSTNPMMRNTIFEQKQSFLKKEGSKNNQHRHTVSTPSLLCPTPKSQTFENRNPYSSLFKQNKTGPVFQNNMESQSHIEFINKNNLRLGRSRLTLISNEQQKSCFQSRNDYYGNIKSSVVLSTTKDKNLKVENNTKKYFQNQISTTDAKMLKSPINNPHLNSDDQKCHNSASMYSSQKINIQSLSLTNPTKLSMKSMPMKKHTTLHHRTPTATPSSNEPALQPNSAQNNRNQKSTKQMTLQTQQFVESFVTNLFSKKIEAILGQQSKINELLKTIEQKDRCICLLNEKIQNLEQTLAEARTAQKEGAKIQEGLNKKIHQVEMKIAKFMTGFYQFKGKNIEKNELKTSQKKNLVGKSSQITNEFPSFAQLPVVQGQQELESSYTYFLHPELHNNIEHIADLYQRRQQKPIRCYIDNLNLLRYKDTHTFVYNRKGDPITLSSEEAKYYTDRGFLEQTKRNGTITQN